MVDLKKNIKAQGWTISQLAERLGITQSSLSVQLGNGTTPLSRVADMANIMNVPLTALLRDDESPSLNSITVFQGETYVASTIEELEGVVASIKEKINNPF